MGAVQGLLGGLGPPPTTGTQCNATPKRWSSCGVCAPLATKTGVAPHAPVGASRGLPSSALSVLRLAVGRDMSSSSLIVARAASVAHTEQGGGCGQSTKSQKKTKTATTVCGAPSHPAKYIHLAQRAQFRMESDQYLQLQMTEITRQRVGTCTPSGKPPNLSPFSHLSGKVWLGGMGYRGMVPRMMGAAL
jgi:hypothetical protein